MSRQRDREEFIAILASEGIPLTVTRALMRAGTSLHRIAELQCSSEVADRDRVRCPGGGRLRLDKQTGGTVLDACLCRDYGSWNDETRTHGTVPRVNVQEAKIQERVEKLCATYGLKPIFQGDPRGAVLKLKVPSGRTNDWGRTGICVP